MATHHKKTNISTPSFFWENFLMESIPGAQGSPAVKDAQNVADRVRGLIERFNDRIVAVRNNPTANDPQKRLQIEKIAKKAKIDFEAILNHASKSITTHQQAINSKIEENIRNADRIDKQLTISKINSLSPKERSSFIRNLINGGDFESLSHIIGRSAAFLEIDPEEFNEIKQAYISGQHPEEHERLTTFDKIQANFKGGFNAVYSEFEEFQSGISEKVEAAEAALRE